MIALHIYTYVIPDMIPGVNIISGKVNVNVNGAGGMGSGVCSEPKEHLEWLETYLNAAGIITVQGYKHTKN